MQVTFVAMSVDDQSQTPSERKSAIKKRHERAASEVLPDHPELYIGGGRWVKSASSETFTTVDPTTGETLAERVEAGNGGTSTARSTRPGRPTMMVYSSYSSAERQAMLEAIADRIENNADEFARLESLDNGKPITEARIDIELVVDHFRYFAGIARAHEGRTVDTDDSRHVKPSKNPTASSAKLFRGISRF